MQINLITGVDGSGKSYVFEKLKQLKFSGVYLLLVPKLDEKSIENLEIKNIAIAINKLGEEASLNKSTSFKALNLFASMMIFSDICDEKKIKNTILFCERHPLIDAQIYAKFYVPLLKPDLLFDIDLEYLDSNYVVILDAIIHRIPSELLNFQNSKSKTIFDFIFKYFTCNKNLDSQFYKQIFRLDFPNNIYFLNGDSTVFYNRLISREHIEIHEKPEVLQMLNNAYSELFNKLQEFEIEYINANSFEALNLFYNKLVNRISVLLSSKSENFPNVPGRGLVTEQSTLLRQTFLENINHAIPEIKNSKLSHTDVKNKIESFVGSVEIPLGLVGPLLYQENCSSEMVYTFGGTLEGALIASMNRGAKAISLSGGFSAHFVHQKMVRSPMFQFQNLKECVLFQNWIIDKFVAIKKVCELYSNHAYLIEIKPLVISRSVHLNFIFETGDASGQNMTTTCTWHAMLWIVEHFETEIDIKIRDYVIEGNCSSDKKTSSYTIQNGRGVHVIAECHLTEAVINSILRTTSDAIFNNYLPSISATRFYGMPSYNINVANAIAAIFVATGQDLASIHESSNAFLSVEKTSEGLYFSLTLPSLVIATVGGGTNLPRQQEALMLMNCFGKDKIQRFAKMIAGFALGLEISTYSAIVSGAFAKAHEKLGRNKPLNWITKSEIDTDFIKNIINIAIDKTDILEVSLVEKSIENGIITLLSSAVNNKLLGFFEILISYKSGKKASTILLKSNATDDDVIKGLHKMAAQINPKLADLIYSHRHFLEYNNCHKKEILIYKVLFELNLNCIPKFYGSYENQSTETYFILQELLQSDNLLLIDSENNPELWTRSLIEKAIVAISNCHKSIGNNSAILESISVFNVNDSIELYEKLLFLTVEENAGLISNSEFNDLLLFNNDLSKYKTIAKLPLVVIHNDFNPRNVAVLKDESICIYDWELVVQNIPHRDIIEFLSFTLPENFSKSEFEYYLKFHFDEFDMNIDYSTWKEGYIFALNEFIVTRACLYCVANIVLKLKFHKKIITNSLRMLSILKN